MENTIAVILGGGKGTRLFPLTRERSKPAVPLAGKYRLIDIPVSNCINSGCRRIFVLTMYQSASLNNHVANAYRFDAFSHGFVQVLAAEQTSTDETWFRGTADAVRQNLNHLRDEPCKRTLVLSGDHLYRMDYARFLEGHNKAKADLSIAVKPVSREAAPELGLLKVDDTGRIVRFVEKPSTEAELDEMVVDTKAFGLTEQEAAQYPFLASMGVYLFNNKVLDDLLLADLSQTDFGKEIIPGAIETRNAQAFCHNDYWADIGTVGAFYQANMELINPLPGFNLFDPNMPIYTNARFLPGAKLNRASVEGAVLCDGSIVEGAMVRESILGVRTRVRPGAILERSLVMGADYYQPGTEPGHAPKPFLGIGEGAYLRKVIVDKNACIGEGVQLVNRGEADHYDDPEGRFYVRDGIIVVAKKAVLPDGFVF